jgi:hypothetical protein
MRHNDGAHFFPVFSSRSEREAAGVDSNTLIDKKTGQTLF